VGGYPDFWLTVWDWKKESIVLRSKAFSQDVFDVHFSPFFEGQLTSSGTGHIRFWKMAGTFTGLKLQGDIGRFGNEDLSDIAGYAELPDGKVLSGTESGRLLLWDGGLIKAVLLREGAGRRRGESLPCHAGCIEVVRLDATAGLVHTAGADGYVRTWDFAAINDAEPGEDSSVVFIEPLREARVETGETPAEPGRGVGASGPTSMSIRAIIMHDDHWVVQDDRGSLVHVAVEGGVPVPGEARQLATFHAGPITGLDVSAVSDHAATCGADGTVRLFAYATRRQIFSTKVNTLNSGSLYLKP
jgi:WD40 repeat protein